MRKSKREYVREEGNLSFVLYDKMSSINEAAPLVFFFFALVSLCRNVNVFQHLVDKKGDQRVN